MMDHTFHPEGRRCVAALTLPTTASPPPDQEGCDDGDGDGGGCVLHSDNTSWTDPQANFFKIISHFKKAVGGQL